MSHFEIPVSAPSPNRARRLSPLLLLRVLRRRWHAASLRNSDFTLAALAVLTGFAAGLGVVALHDGVDAFHHLAFAIGSGEHLSDELSLDWWRILLIPSGGGLIVGLVAAGIRRWRPREIVDAIEANALYGGRMSLIDSINLALLTVLSGGFGASVGLEAAYTQLGSSLASKLGLGMRLRREDMRTMVGCGAAAAIAAAFNAPLAGAFYAFELILGSYTMATLIPVTIAALAGSFTVRAIFGPDPIFIVNAAPAALHPPDYFAFFLVGVGAAGLGIATMRGVTLTEAAFRRYVPLRILSPALGGLLVGLLGLIWPQVLGSGHGAILYNLNSGYALPYLVSLTLAKAAASALSVGTGFRGGLFSSSLFIGSLFGSAAAIILQHLLPWAKIDSIPYTLVGMGAFAATVVGAPVTMILLVLESTGDFSTAVGVMVGVIAATALTRQFFGYSFATWRFHLRGIKVRSPADIGWIDELRVGRMMRSDPKIVAADASVAQLREMFPLGAVKQIFAAEDGRLVGIIDLADLHAPGHDGAAATLSGRDVMRPVTVALLPHDNLRSALDRFDETQQDVLPVVDNAQDAHVVGYLSEAFALRRYSQELEKRDPGSGLLPGAD